MDQARPGRARRHPARDRAVATTARRTGSRAWHGSPLSRTPTRTARSGRRCRSRTPTARTTLRRARAGTTTTASTPGRPGGRPARLRLQEQDRSFYVVSSLSDDDVDGNPSDDYVVKDANGVWDLNDGSPIVSTLDCIKSGGSTSYSLAIEEAQHELAAHGRPDVQDVIVFFTDGGANSTQDAPRILEHSTPWDRPCGQASRPRSAARRHGVYTIGYDLENRTPSPSAARSPARPASRTTASPRGLPDVGLHAEAGARGHRLESDNAYYTPTRRSSRSCSAGRRRRPQQRGAPRRQRPSRLQMEMTTSIAPAGRAGKTARHTSSLPSSCRFSS